MGPKDSKYLTFGENAPNKGLADAEEEAFRVGNSASAFARTCRQACVDVREELHSRYTFNLCIGRCTNRNSSEARIWYSGTKRRLTIYQPTTAAGDNPTAASFYALAKVLRSARVIIDIEPKVTTTVAELLAHHEIIDNFDFLMSAFGCAKAPALRELDIHFRLCTNNWEPRQVVWDTLQETQVHRYLRALKRVPSSVELTVHIETLAQEKISVYESQVFRDRIRAEIMPARQQLYFPPKTLLKQYLQLRAWSINTFSFAVFDTSIEGDDYLCYHKGKFRELLTQMQPMLIQALTKAWNAHWTGDEDNLSSTKTDLQLALTFWSRRSNEWMEQDFMRRD